MTIIWTTTARQFLREIRDYIATDSPSRADKHTIQIIDKVDLLAVTPRIGREPSELEGSGILQIMHGNYRILYRISDESLIYVLAVIHCSRDFKRLRLDLSI